MEFKNQLVSINNNMLSYALTLTDNREDAYDLLQDTNLKALDNRDKYIDNTNFKSWVLNIMHNLFINQRISSRTVSLYDTAEGISSLHMACSGEMTPEGFYSVGEISHAIEQLSDCYRLPFSMHVAGYLYFEIAEKMHLPLGTVKSRIHGARMRLQQMLGD